MKIIAHRGASGQYPENTLLAIEKAIEQGADGVELDVFYHHSGELIVLHDAYLDIKTNGDGHFNAHSIDALKQFDAGQGQSIPTLTEVVKHIAGRCLLNIEIKTSSSCDSDIEMVCQAVYAVVDFAVESCQFERDQIIVSTFNHPLLAQLKAQNGKLVTGALTASCPLSYAGFRRQDWHRTSTPNN